MLEESLVEWFIRTQGEELTRWLVKTYWGRECSERNLREIRKDFVFWAGELWPKAHIGVGFSSFMDKFGLSAFVRADERGVVTCGVEKKGMVEFPIVVLKNGWENMFESRRRRNGFHGKGCGRGELYYW